MLSQSVEEKEGNKTAVYHLSVWGIMKANCLLMSGIRMLSVANVNVIPTF